MARFTIALLVLSCLTDQIISAPQDPQNVNIYAIEIRVNGAELKEFEMKGVVPQNKEVSNDSESTGTISTPIPSFTTTEPLTTPDVKSTKTDLKTTELEEDGSD